MSQNELKQLEKDTDGVVKTMNTAEEKNDVDEKPFVRKSKAEKRKENFLKWKSRVKAKKEEKKKERAAKREATLAALDAGLPCPSHEHQNNPPSSKKKKSSGVSMAESSAKVTVVIDCGFGHLMPEKDINKLCCQIRECFSLNRKSSNPLQLHATSVTDDRLLVALKTNQYHKWDMMFHDQPFEEVFSLGINDGEQADSSSLEKCNSTSNVENKVVAIDSNKSSNGDNDESIKPTDINIEGEKLIATTPDKNKFVYLTSDSNNVLNDLDDDKIYIIGGLIDHNRYKGLCHSMAKNRGYHHARLPLSENVELNSRAVITVNQVYAILLAYWTFHHNGDTDAWKKAILQGVPSRKIKQSAKEKME